MDKPQQTMTVRRAPAMFVAAGHQGQRLVSTDGIEWKLRELGKDGEVYRGVCFGNSRCVAVGTYGDSNIFASSSDTFTWTTHATDPDEMTSIRGFGFGNGTFLASAGHPTNRGDSSPSVMTSADGIRWGDAARITGRRILRRIAFGSGRFVGVGDYGRRSTSTDALHWQDVSNVKPIDTLVDVAFGTPAGGGLFVGVGLNGLRMTTTDGITWSNPLRGEEGEHLNSIVWTGDRFVAVGIGVTLFSPDGARWERRNNVNAPLTVAYGAPQGKPTFIGPNWKGRLFHSTDAVEWRQVFKSDYHIEAVCYGSA